jgi:hydrogenase maturation protease
MSAPDTLIVGLGNPYLGDDGVGWRVAEALRPRLDRTSVEIRCLALGGLALMEQIAGFRRCVIVDAVVSGARPGEVRVMDSAELADRSSHHTASVHDLGLAHALDLGRALGLDLPERLGVVGVEARPEFTFGEDLSPAVAAAVPKAVASVEGWLQTP